jgi:hypothetical protein
MSSAYSGGTSRVRAPWETAGISPRTTTGGNPVGFFKDIKSTLGSTTEAAKHAPAAKQAAETQATAAQAGLAEGTYDPGDPGFERRSRGSRSISTPSCARRWPVRA